MSLRVQSGVIAVLGGIAAVWAGISIANESYLIPGLLLVMCALALAAWFRLRFEVLLLTGALFGYIVGNRGFAQLMIVPGLPLFVAELALAGSCAALLYWGAFTKTLPFRRDLLNVAVLGWVLIGAIRLVVDFRTHGFLALRDGAMCYYALYFFVAQHVTQDAKAGRWLRLALIAALAVLPFTFLAWVAAPEFVSGHLLVNGIPLILYKADLAATMLAAGVFLFFHLTHRSPWAWIGVLACFVGALVPLTRAAMLSLVVVLGWHVVARRWRLIGALALSGVLLAAAEIGLAEYRGQAWAKTRTYQIVQYGATVLPFVDARAIELEPGDVKGNPVDNNAFRLVWWATVASQTWHENPVFGLGFGYDLATEFLVEYGLMADPDFTARSPHSILLSTFGRLGLLGATVFTLLLVTLFLRTLRAVRLWQHDAAASETPALWFMCWVILISACFGVVLEGPMGAVVFWTVLGLANATATQPPGESDVVSDDSRAADARATFP